MEMVYEYSGITETEKNPHLCICPKDGEIVEVFESIYSNRCYQLPKYPVDINGMPQHFHKRHFRPLSDVLDKISISELLEEVVEC